MTTAPEEGADADDPTGRLLFGRQDRPAGHLCGRGCVRVSSSCAEDYRFTARAATGSSRAQSERDLAVPEAAGRRAEGRASGKSDGTRSDRPETSGGVVAVLSAAPKAVCCGAAGCRRSDRLVTVTVGGEERVLCSQCAETFARRKAR